LATTALARATPAALGRACAESTIEPTTESITESLRALLRRLGDRHAPVFRLMTPPAMHDLGWVVVRVILPGLQPLHGDHALPFLGGPAWGDRPVAAYAEIPPHPFA
ncbi:MAG TPA: hypothetical protein VGC42_28050, partial [Kofleriaceae bacterium]